MAAAPVRVTNALVIAGGHMKEPWVPKDVRTLDGMSFMRLSKGDRRFAAFVGADLKSPHPLDHDEWLGALLALRNAAVTAAAEARSAAEDAGPLPPRKHWIEDAPKVVSVQVPAFVSEGVEVPGRTLRMLSPLNPNECIAVEASDESLDFIRRGVRNGIMGQKRQHKPSAHDRVTFPGCPAAHYNKARDHVYVTVEDSDGRKRYKSFAIAEATDKAKQEAAERAQRFYDSAPESWTWDD